MLLAIITIIQRAQGKRLMLKLFSSFIVMLGLVMITAMMIAATLTGFLINLHNVLLHTGISPLFVLLWDGFAALLTITILFAVIAWRLRHLRSLPKTLGGGSSLVATLDAFSAGFMAD